jgi:hypothetical protein
MKNLCNLFAVLCITFILAGCTDSQSKKSKSRVTGLGDLSDIRGFNYTPAGVAQPRHHIDCWVKYDETVIEHDLDLAVRLKLNQVRVFVPYQVYVEIKDTLTGRLRHFVRACNKRGIGVMPVVGSGAWVRDTTLRAQAREWAEFLTNAISGEPGLAFWDVMNEPDWPRTPRERVLMKFENSKYMSRLFHELDRKTPVTIGMAFVEGMEELADYVDVLQFHDYMQTGEQIRNNIIRAKQFAAKVGKPVFNGEIGCVARANPYDITLQEHMKGGVGWYIWELMIVRKGWGTVHGVFYEDGTVRDPSIAAAILGFFRNREENILPAVADNEGWVTRIVNNGNKWLEKSDTTWSEGLDIAETAAHLLEAGELAPMRIPPTWEVQMMRRGKPDLPALRVLFQRYIDMLIPYMRRTE